MAARKIKIVCIILVIVTVLLGLKLLFSRRVAETQQGRGEEKLGIEGYSQLSSYVIAEDPDSIKDALTALLGEIDAVSQPDRTEISVSGAGGIYEGWYTANSFAAYRMPSELPLEDSSQLRQQAVETIGQLGWETAEPVFEQITDKLYYAAFQPQLNGVPLDGFQISLWLDADGIQRIEATDYIHIAEEGSVYDLASMYSGDAVILRLDDVFSDDARQRNRQLPRLGYPMLTYTQSEEKPGQLFLAWKLEFEESYQDANGEAARQSGYYLVDAEQLSVIRRVEEEESGGLVLFREWETIIRCILGLEYTVDVAESENTADLTITVTGPGGSYTGVAAQDEYLKFCRDSVGTGTARPTDEEIQALAGGLAEALDTVLLKEPLIYRNGARMEVYFYLGSTQNNSVCLLYDAQGLLSAELLTGTVLQSEIPDGAAGTYTVPAAQVDERILAPLQNGGLAIQCDAELPETPDSVPAYTVEAITMDCDSLIRAVFGQDCDYVLEPDANGSHCYHETAEGIYVINCEPDWGRFSILRTEPAGAELSYEEEDFVELAETIIGLPGLDIFQGTYEKKYMLSFDKTQLLYQVNLEGVPVSPRSYYLSGMEGSVKGTYFSLSYDSYGLYSLEIRKPEKATPTGTDITGILSADRALALVESQMGGSSVDAVQVIRSIQLVYLRPAQDSDELIPAWELSYDMYTFSGTNDEVDVCTGEYQYLIEAVSGQLYSYH